MRAELKLIPPKEGRTPFYQIRGTHLGVFVYQSTRSRQRSIAEALLRHVRNEIEADVVEGKARITFEEAAIAFMEFGSRGRRLFMEPLLHHFRGVKIRDIDQIAVDRAAMMLAPRLSNATRNREIYTPVISVLRHAGREVRIRRPQGAQGTSRLFWLREAHADALIRHAWTIHARFAALLTFLLYTGCRISEALRLRVEDLDLERGFALLPMTKNGHARALHLPPIVVSSLRRAWAVDAREREQIESRRRPNQRPRPRPPLKTVFGFTKGGLIYHLLSAVEAAAGMPMPKGAAFHAFRHTYGAWMRQYAKADRAELVATGAWRSMQGAAPYDHLDCSEAARKADLFPGANKTLIV